MFSVHAWPFVLAPGLIALGAIRRDGPQPHRRLVRALLIGAILLSLVQTALAVQHLLRLTAALPA
jgi:RsiW-degrading membrane proteinase PrsW (M82 family)